jgi:hypothetical protein
MTLGATNSKPFKTSKHAADQNTMFKKSGPFIINIKLMLFVEIVATYFQ